MGLLVDFMAAIAYNFYDPILAPSLVFNFGISES